MSEVSNEELIKVNRRLDTLIGISLNQSKIQVMSMGEKINYLSKLGYENQEIADILDTTYSTVAKEKSKRKGKNHE